MGPGSTAFTEKCRVADSYRIVLFVDIEAESATEAYEKLYVTMMATELAWESTDEWFESDGAEPMSENDISAARDAFFARRKIL